MAFRHVIVPLAPTPAESPPAAGTYYWSSATGGSIGVDGQLDRFTAAHFYRLASGNPPPAGSDLDVDLRCVTSIDADGLNALTALGQDHRRRGVHLVLLCSLAVAHRLFDLAGVLDPLPTTDA